MLDLTKIQVGSIIEFKKPHPCGSTTWKVLRTGVDFKLECCGCEREIMISRLDVGKRLKRILENSDEE